MTEIDLAQAKIIGEKELASVWGRLGNWLMPTAEAKANRGIYRTALINREGTRLYLYGQGTDEPPVEMPLEFTGPKVVHRSDLPVTDGALSPDGRFLLLSGMHIPTATRDGFGYRAHPKGVGLYVLDAVTLEQRAHLESDVALYVVGFSPDSRYACLREVLFAENINQATAPLKVLDLQSLQFVARRPVKGHVSQLLGVPPYR